MKITCILTSFNRPTWLRHALASIEAQTYGNYQLIVVDESTTFDVRATLKDFRLTCCDLLHYDVSPLERAQVNRLSSNINQATRIAKGQLLCYLADDDFYYPHWFASAVEYFVKHQDVSAGYGKLVYSHCRDMDYPEGGSMRFPAGPLQDPFEVLDHNQIIHRPLLPPIEWPLHPSTIGCPDAYFMRDVGKRHAFFPIDAMAAVKRVGHGKNLQHNTDTYLSGHMEGSRE